MHCAGVFLNSSHCFVDPCFGVSSLRVGFRVRALTHKCLCKSPEPKDFSARSRSSWLRRKKSGKRQVAQICFFVEFLQRAFFIEQLG